MFDPAFKHFPTGRRPGTPAFASDQLADAWHTARSAMVCHTLRAAARCDANRLFVLRGSAALPMQLGQPTRAPHDIDFIVTLPGDDIDAPRGVAVIDSLRDAVLCDPPAGITLDSADVTLDDIWAYDRVPGRRLVFRWRSAGLPWGTTQIDLVFGEHLPEPAQRVALPGSPSDTLAVASLASALAWKLLWLWTDMHPQAKDLFDAAMLAEAAPLDEAVLRAAFEQARETWPSDPGPAWRRMVTTELEWLDEPRDTAAAIDAWDRLLAACPALGTKVQ